MSGNSSEGKTLEGRAAALRRLAVGLLAVPAIGQGAAAQPATITPIPPQALTECGALFSQARVAANSSPVSVQWSTSYMAGATRFMGVTALTLSPHNDDLVGMGRRARFSGATPELKLFGPGEAPSPEYVTLTIRTDDTMMFNDRFGPYVPLCTGDRFAFVLSGDSIEVFNFPLPSP